MDILRRKAKPQLKPPDTLSRFVVTKHAWYKAYKRIFCITPTAIHTQNPERTLVLTNSYSFVGDSDIESVTLGSDEFEFVISARQDKKVGSRRNISRAFSPTESWCAWAAQLPVQMMLANCAVLCCGLWCCCMCEQSKFKALKFSCKHRQLLLTDLFQCMAAANALGRCLLAAKVLG